MPMAVPALCHNIYYHHQYSVLNSHNISYEKGRIGCGIVTAIGANLKIRIHFQWPILSLMSVTGCSGTTPCDAILDGG